MADMLAERLPDVLEYCSIPIEIMFAVIEAIVVHCEFKQISSSDLLYTIILFFCDS
jgi:hypothetical protein